MAGFGESVGDAYIEVHADARPFRREIRRDARRAGKEAGSAFDDGFKSELGDTFTNIGKDQERRLKKSGLNTGRIFADSMGRGVEQRLRRFNINLSDALNTGDFSKVIKEFDTLDDAVKGVDARFRRLRQGQRLTRQEYEAARRSFKAYADEIRKNTAWSEMVAEAIKEDKRRTKAVEKEAAKRKKVIDREVADTKRANKEMADSNRRSLEEIADSLLNLADAGNKRHKTEIKRIEDERKARNKAHGEALRDMRQREKERDSSFRSEIKGWADSQRSFRAFEMSVNAGMRRMDRLMRMRRRDFVVGGASRDDIAAFERQYADMRTQIERVHADVEKSQRGFFTRMRGARNNFVHLLGSLGSPIERVIGHGIEKVFSGIGGGISSLGENIAKHGGPIGKFGEKMSQFGDVVGGLGGKGGLIGIAIGVGAFLASLQLLVPILGTVVSLASGLLGIATALASTVGIALVGAIGSLLPIVGALVIAFAGLAIAFHDFEGDFEALKAAAKPFMDTFSEVRSNLQEAFAPAMHRVAERFADVLERLQPVFEALGNALLEWLDSFGALFQTPGMEYLLTTMGTTLPGVIRELGGLFNNIFLAISAIITAAAPVVEQFLGVMGDAIGEWATWAASAEGQTAIYDFFTEAAEAAEILWDVVSGLGDVLLALFGAGLEDGNNLWTTIGDKLREFADWLRTDEGQEKLKEWFDRAMDLAESLGDVATAVSDLIIELDDMNSSGLLDKIIGVIVWLVGVLEWMARTWDTSIMTLYRGWTWLDSNVFTPFSEGIAIIQTAWALVMQELEDRWNGMVGALSNAWMWLNTNVFTPIRAGLTTIQAAFLTFTGTVSFYWSAFTTALYTGWLWLNNNVFTPLKLGVAGIVSAFSLAVQAVSIAWQRLKNAVAEPVNAVIRVYNSNIKGPFEKVADAVGLKWRLPTVPEVKFATGGVMPGYTPGRDVHEFVSSTGGRLSLSGGEAIMRPEWTRAVGGPKAVAAMNRAARRGQAFASGGVFNRNSIAGDSSGGTSILDRINQIVGNTANALHATATLLSDPGTALKEIILSPLKAALSSLPGAKFGELFGGIAYDLASALVDKFTEAAKEATATMPGGAGAASGALDGGWKTMWNIVRSAFPWANLHSGFRPGAITATGYPSMHGKGRAIDITPSAEIFNWLRANFPGSYELIFSPMGAAQLYKGRSYVFPEPTKRMHYNHIHWAMANGGVWDPSGQPDAGVFSHMAAPVGPVASPAGAGLPVTAKGGLFAQAQSRIIAEAGREAVVPLDRPLSQVDPAVRGLAAYAQGGRGETNITVVSPHADPYHVALDTVDELARRSLA